MAAKKKPTVTATKKKPRSEKKRAENVKPLSQLRERATSVDANDEDAMMAANDEALAALGDWEDRRRNGPPLTHAEWKQAMVDAHWTLTLALEKIERAYGPRGYAQREAARARVLIGWLVTNPR